ncbi:hypothetical protein P4829_17240 [Bacillus atrophaeus]|nr:hypothetical protein [Bacillus atrophaeus]WFE13592.1 hypothetical protein P4829_17240 [Bacillus atrophaeus]
MPEVFYYQLFQESITPAESLSSTTETITVIFNIQTAIIGSSIDE